jgi:hypothetical protein
MVTGRHTRYASAHLFHHACAFVPEHDRGREGDRAVQDRDVAVAQAGLHDPDLDLPVARWSNLDVVPNF